MTKEAILRRVLHAQEKVLSRDHIETLSSVYWLSQCPYHQRQFADAENMLRRARVIATKRDEGLDDTSVFFSARVLLLLVMTRLGAR